MGLNLSCESNMVLQMDKVSGATECLHSGMTEPTILQRSCNLSCESNAFQGPSSSKSR